MRRRKKRFLALGITVAHGVGALTSVQAVMNTHTAQGAVAWAVSLNTFPYLAVPAYWVFGRTKFEGSVTKRRGGEEQAHPLVTGFIARAKRDGLVVPVRDEGSSRIAERLAKLPATSANRVELLRDGGAIFPSIFDGIGQAKSYVLVQFYIVRDDALGRQLQQHLIAAARRGVSVHFVYDQGDSALVDLSGCAYVERLGKVGVQFYRHTKDFMHQKVTLVDSDLATGPRAAPVRREPR